MSTTATTLRPVARTADASDEDRRLTAYRTRVDTLRSGYRRRARRNGIAANGVSLLLVTAGAAVGLSPLFHNDANVTAVLGVAVILLEGVTRVLRPALRATRARKVARKLDRTFRLYDVRGVEYRYGGADGDEAFVLAVERILQEADAAEEHDEAGTAAEPTSSRKTS